jgi:hypothetical protein
VEVSGEAKMNIDEWLNVWAAWDGHEAIVEHLLPGSVPKHFDVIIWDSPSWSTLK